MVQFSFSNIKVCFFSLSYTTANYISQFFYCWLKKPRHLNSSPVALNDVDLCCLMWTFADWYEINLLMINN